MKILQIINNIAWGGAGNLLTNYIPLMKELGHEVELLVLKKIDNYHSENFRKKGIKITTLSESTLYNPLFVFKIRKYINNGNFDIVHVHLFPALYYVGIAAYFGIKSNLVFTEHNTTNRRMENSLFRVIDKFIYRKYNLIICISDKVKLNIQNHLSGLTIVYSVVSNGVNLSKFSNNYENDVEKQNLYPAYSNQDVIIIMVARFDIQKDQKTLINSMLLLPENFHLLLVGDGPLKVDCENLVSKINLNNRIHFLGIRKDIPDILHFSNIGVLSSNWEGVPITALECMASGKPIIGSDVQGISDTINKAGILFEKGNSKQLAEKILELVNNKEYYNDVAKRCLEKSKEYDIVNMTKKYLELYHELVEGKI